MPEGWYPHEPGEPFYALECAFLHEHPESCSAIGRWRGARDELSARCYSRSSTAWRAAALLGWACHQMHFPSRALAVIQVSSSKGAALPPP